MSSYPPPPDFIVLVHTFKNCRTRAHRTQGRRTQGRRTWIDRESAQKKTIAARQLDANPIRRAAKSFGSEREPGNERPGAGRTTEHGGSVHGSGSVNSSKAGNVLALRVLARLELWI